MIAIAVGGSAACGPLVPAESDGDGDSSGFTSVGNDTATRTEGEDGEGDDSRPPDPSDPSGPSDTTADPDTGLTMSSSMTAGESGPVPEGCGDGVVDSEEECDDGNTEDGDECSSQCNITVVILWTATHDGAASSFDVANDVVVGADDSIYVVGGSRVVAGASDVWLQQYFADGSAGWTFHWDGLEGLADEGHAIAWTPSGQLVVVGSTESMATGEDILVLLVDPMQPSVVWSRVIDGPGSGPGEYDEIDVAEDVGVDPSGNIVVAATMRVGAGDYDAWIGELSPDGVDLRWVQTFASGAGSRDAAHAVTVNGAGDVAVLVEREDEEDAVTMFYDDEGVPLDGVTHSYAAHDMARRPDGGYALVGVDDDDFDADLIVSALDDGLNPWWSNTVPGSGDDDLIGVAAGPSSEVAAVGTKGESGQQSNAWISVVRDDGSPWWGTSHNGEADLEDAFRAAAFDSTGAVIAVGSETIIGQQSNAFVRKYLPL
jgi:cysteine-rich repeat protein